MKSRFSLAFLAASLTAVAVAGPGAASSPAATGLQGQRIVAAAPVPTADRASVPAGGGLIAPPTECPDQEDLAGSAASQEQAMGCMVDFARRQAGLDELVDSAVLAQSSGDKSLDILRCDSFSHFACGRDFTYWMKETGYTSSPCWRVGENLAWGTGGYGSVRPIFIAWMRSPTHRANILGDFDESGLSLEVGMLEGESGTRVWAEHFGSHCD